jgi:hypothetical protein
MRLRKTWVVVAFNRVGEVSGITVHGTDGPWLAYGDTAAPHQVKYVPEPKGTPATKKRRR